ncbi:hypothetical protein JKP88DRAFT_291734 [Tribonema minus]|uniref:Homeodomain transcription factor n=1 Tax=Tribonema minus TaxID=303371 RepID=A0A835ZHP8_9STRA|nr:hypothetical protein JKP88DRAFT_291734 [Tribonema minus]
MAKMLAFPFNWRWWRARISARKFAGGSLLYAAQAISLYAYAARAYPGCGGAFPSAIGPQQVVYMHAVLPVLLLLILAVGYGSMVAAAGPAALAAAAAARQHQPSTAGAAADAAAAAAAGAAAAAAAAKGVAKKGADRADVTSTTSQLQQPLLSGGDDGDESESGSEEDEPAGLSLVEDQPMEAGGGKKEGVAKGLALLLTGGGAKRAYRRANSTTSHSSIDAEVDDEDEDDEDDKLEQLASAPVKVTLWAPDGTRQKARLPLSQVRHAILARANLATLSSALSVSKAALCTAATALLPTAYHFVGAAAVSHARGAAAASTLTSTSTCSDDAATGGSGSGGGGDGGAFEVSTCDLSCALSAGVSLLAVAYISWPIFLELAATELVYRRRYKYAKYYMALTSSRRARKYGLPHFPLKSPATIRAWLALRAGRSWLRRRREQREADAIVSAAFCLLVGLLSVIAFEALAKPEAKVMGKMLHWELLAWSFPLGYFVLRFASLGSRTNDRRVSQHLAQRVLFVHVYCDTSVLLTEQINVQLRILHNSARPEGPDKQKAINYQVSNQVLSLATKLLKELDSPNKISGIRMNPMLVNVIRIVLLSALSAIMSETLGFKLKIVKLFKL